MMSGECFCGSVSYEIDGEIGVVYCCHCSRCRKMSGASYTTNGIVSEDCFRITAGKEILHQLGTGSHGRFHCSNCHGWLYASSPEYVGVTFFPCGTLNSDPGREIDYHCQVDSKASWVEISDGKQQFGGALPDELIAAAAKI